MLNVKWWHWLSIGVLIGLSFALAAHAQAPKKNLITENTHPWIHQDVIYKPNPPSEPLPPAPKPKIPTQTERPGASIDTRAIAINILPEYGWENQWDALNTLWNKESGWQPGRLNHSSYACGIPQALPCTKIYLDFSTMERVWVNGKLFLKNPDAEKEIRWGLEYIKNRYGTPTKALQFHYQHNWY